MSRRDEHQVDAVLVLLSLVGLALVLLAWLGS